jgi:hypothetical protein
MGRDMYVPFLEGLEDFMKPDFVRGYQEGYETAKVDMRIALERMKALQEETSTSTTEGE